MLQATIFNIQKFSVHDGPGIRTTFFFKGCPLRCAWCHNPESLSFKPELMHNREKCTQCGACVQFCNDGSITMSDDGIHIDNSKFHGDESILDECIYNALSIVGKRYSVEDAVNIALKDVVFYEQSGGGVTLSGGECLSQIDFVEAFVKQLKAHHIHVTIDTCGHVPYAHIKRVLPYVDLFLYDLKHIDENHHKSFTSVGNQHIIENLKKLSKENTRIFLRIPIIVGVNATHAHMKNVASLIETISVEKINLLPYHAIGEGKYKRLGMTYDKTAFQVPSTQLLEEFKIIFASKKLSVEIGG